MENKLVLNEKELDKDLWIIGLATLVGFLVYMLFGEFLMNLISNKEIHILLRVLVTAFVQFTIAGLGSVIVCIYRKENFSKFGLQKDGTVKSIVGVFICFIPHLIYILASGQFIGYYPLSVLLTDEVLAGSIFTKIFGMSIIALAWGFFEGFNYAIISKKINLRYSNKTVNMGALICALICILIHPFNTSFWGLVNILTTFIFIYGMIEVTEKTENAWGCVLSFCLLWNAF